MSILRHNDYPSHQLRPISLRLEAWQPSTVTNQSTPYGLTSWAVLAPLLLTKLKFR